MKSWVLLLAVGRAVLQKIHQCHHMSKPGKALLTVQPEERKHYMQVRLKWAVVVSRIHSLTWKDSVANSKNYPSFWEQIKYLLTEVIIILKILTSLHLYFSAILLIWPKQTNVCSFVLCHMKKSYFSRMFWKLCKQFFNSRY